jgi:methane/ammonia monooxygenase subunit B
VKGGSRLVLLGLLAAALAVPEPADAHGERNQEPFLRMRTIHWYDVRWSADRLAVNDELTIEGKFRVFSDWPKHLFELRAVYLNLGTAGPVFVKLGSYLNGVPMMQSTTLEYGRDYEFKLVLKARIPGSHHVHPMINVESAGPLLGPGKWIEVTGNAADFVYPTRTLDGIEIPNLETWKIGTVTAVHLAWTAVGLLWVGWWFRRRPVFLPRFEAVSDRREAGLVTQGDRALAAAVLAITLFGVAFGAFATNAKYPYTSALQGGRVRVLPLPAEDPPRVEVRHERGVYHVPGRTLILTLSVTNRSDRPVRLGEFTAANLRFVNRSLPAAVAGVDPSFPPELLPPSGLVVEPDEPIAPGQTRTIRLEASDGAWETERLASLMGNPDSSYGALLFFFDDQGRRWIAEVSGPALPVFVRS